MPIKVTWTAPPSNFLVGYVLYKRVGNTPINTATDLFQVLPADPLAYDDSAYDREVLQTTGYTYGITALGPTGETELSNVQFVQENLDETLFVEEWEIVIAFTEVVEFVEEWEFALGLTPNQLYLEDWDVIPADPGSLSYDEDWEPQEFSDPGALQYDEDWAAPNISDPGVQQYDEDWEEIPITSPGAFQYVEDWEIQDIVNPGTFQYAEDWE